MTGLRIYLDDNRVGPLFKRATTRQGDRVREAMRGAAQDAADEILAQGQDDIEEAGNFGERWVEGLQVDVAEGGGNIRIDVGFQGDDTVKAAWRIFEFGGDIHGKPMLWIPLSFATDAQGLWASAFPQPLFRVDRDGKAPLLFAFTPKEPGALPGSTPKAEPKYFGKEVVHEPQKFHLREIARKVAQQLPDLFKERFTE